MRFYIEILSREISHKYKRGVLNESRIVFDNKWGSFCCSRGFFRRISIIKSSHFFEIVVSGITRSSFCTSYSISWTSTKPESSNGIVTHNTTIDIELIVRCCRCYIVWWSCTTEYWSISNKRCDNIFHTWIDPNITTCTVWFFESNKDFWFFSFWSYIFVDNYVSFKNIYLLWCIYWVVDRPRCWTTYKILSHHLCLFSDFISLGVDEIRWEKIEGFHTRTEITTSDLSEDLEWNSSGGFCRIEWLLYERIANVI